MGGEESSFSSLERVGLAVEIEHYSKYTAIIAALSEYPGSEIREESTLSIMIKWL